MGQENDLLVCDQTRMDLGLLLEHVQTGAGNETLVQGVHESGLVDDGASSGVDHHGGGLHEFELRRGNDVPSLGVEREVQTQHVAALEQVIEGDVLGAVGQFGVQFTPVVVDGCHAKGGGFLFYVASDAAHTENAQGLASRIVAQRRRRLAAPVAASEGDHAGVEVTQGTEQQEDGRVGRGVVGSGWDIGHEQGRVALGAGLRVDLVVAGAAVGQISPGFRKGIAQLGVEAASQAN